MVKSERWVSCMKILDRGISRINFEPQFRSKEHRKKTRLLTDHEGLRFRATSFPGPFPCQGEGSGNEVGFRDPLVSGSCLSHFSVSVQFKGPQSRCFESF